MKPMEIVALVRKHQPDALGEVSENKSAKIIHAALVQLGKHINAMNEGVLRVPGFGQFRVRRIEREKDGKKITVRRTVFQVARGKAKTL